jgi:hypothetical protein
MAKNGKSFGKIHKHHKIGCSSMAKGKMLSRKRWLTQIFLKTLKISHFLTFLIN